MNNLNHTDLQNATEKIIQATHVYIVSNRSTISLGTFLQYYLDLLFGKSELIHTTASAFDRIHNVNEDDVVIGISFARYTQSTLDILSYANRSEEHTSELQSRGHLVCRL